MSNITKLKTAKTVDQRKRAARNAKRLLAARAKREAERMHRRRYRAFFDWWYWPWERANDNGET